MSHTDPYPTGKRPKPYELRWLAAVELKLNLISQTKQREFQEVLTSRRSTRRISIAPLNRIAKIVRDALQIEYYGIESMAVRKRKVAASAGALHPIRAFIIRNDGAAIYYDDERDQFFLVTPKCSEELMLFLETCKTLLPAGNCDFVVLFADPRNGERVYNNYQSLLWRDAGAVLQVMSLIAEANGMASCLLGVLGQEVVDALVQEPDKLIGVGVLAIGLPNQYL